MVHARTSVVSVAPLCGPPKPITPIDPVLGISLVGHSRDVIRLFSRASVFPQPCKARLDSKRARKRASFLKRAPRITTAVDIGAKPIVETGPTGFRIHLLRCTWNVIGFFPGAAICGPLFLIIEFEITREGARFLEPTPVANTTQVGSKPISPASPTRIGVDYIRSRRNVVGPFPSPAIFTPVSPAFEF